MAEYQNIFTRVQAMAPAYAGVPLILDGTEAIGSLCAVDFAPRTWSALDAEVLGRLHDPDQPGR